MSLALHGVTKTYGSLVALRDASLQVGASEMLAVLGPSGSGKTTLLRTIAGLARVDRGTITLGERDVTDIEPQHRNIAFVFQDFALFPHLDVRANLAFGARGVPGDSLAQIAKRFRIDALLDRAIDTLSGGEKQRVAVARAIASQPAALLFDEPFASLDAPLRSALRAELVDMREAAPVPSIFVTHDQSEALALGDRVAVMAAGQIVALDTPAALLAAPPTAFVARFLGAPPANVFSGYVVDGRFTATDDATITCDAAALEAGPWTIAVRPEAVRIDANGGVRGRVRLVEIFGVQRYASVVTTGASLVCGVGGDVRTGDVVGLTIDYARMWTYAK